MPRLSCEARVTSEKSLSLCRWAKESVMLATKSFHFRQKFSDSDESILPAQMSSFTAVQIIQCTDIAKLTCAPRFKGNCWLWQNGQKGCDDMCDVAVVCDVTTDVMCSWCHRGLTSPKGVFLNMGRCHQYHNSTNCHCVFWKSRVSGFGWIKVHRWQPVSVHLIKSIKSRSLD